MKIVPVILSGGSGTRLWPVSTPACPKQFLRLVDPDRSLFQQTLARGQGTMFAPPIVVASERHRALVAAQLDEVGVAPGAVLLEPVARNTAPAIALAALHADEDALLLVMPSDHRIGDEAAFIEALARAKDAATEGALVTFGITPDRPETGFGYIALGAEVSTGSGVFAVERFVEKPEADGAVAMLAEGGYLWNAGIFLFTARSYLDQLEKFQPNIAAHARTAMASAVRDGNTITPAAEAFCQCPAQSIDYGVMEYSDRVVTVPLSCSWSDVGSWDAIAELSEPLDARGDRDVTIIDAAGSYVYAEGIGVSLCGIENVIVIATKDQVLILPRSDAQRVRDVVAARDSRAD